MNLACPYCKDVFNEISGLVKCVKCSAHYHHECFQENRKCAIYGCISTQTISVGSKRAAFNETIIENTTVLSYQSNDNKAFAIFTKTILVIAVVLFVLWLVMAR